MDSKDKCLLSQRKRKKRLTEDDNPSTHINHRRQTTLPDRLWQRTV
ncbi:hypothetical protein E2C01_080976 [Portunus trituberculatus]|uniref:Uncharacterized protein n=1 Tax=Portunus trituberculatus TaxID=210409 RepID=A0A5B7INM7_PORTR|nr:hypothetical protein [Portunus trituberculatus]